MDGGLYARFLAREPALVTALFTLVGGFVAQAGPGHIASLKALGTSVTVSGLQGIFTRERVVSPATKDRLTTAPAASAGTQSGPLDPVSPWLAQGAEPALMSSLVGLAGGFLLQLVGGAPDLLQALGISAGLAGTQGVLTRQQVYSPRTVALGLLAPGANLGGLLGAGAPSGGQGPSAALEAALGSPTQEATPPATGLSLATRADPALDLGLAALLRRYRPELRYDSLESYFADSAAVITNRPGNLLKRQDGTVIATAGGAHPALTLSFLAANHYANGQPVVQSDYIDEVGNDYVSQARQMHSMPDLADRVHGRVVIDSAGARWLQYWFFMYYDDPGFLGFGTHEGDIEMIQLRLDANDQPDAASYSQHRSGVRATWSQLELSESPDGLVPVTYSARGSHANLLRAGQQISDRSFLPDHNDGKGHRVRPELVVLSATDAPWCLWPGSWGGTRATGPFGSLGVAANSPAALTHHRAWADPSGFHASCDLPDPLPPAGTATVTGLPGPPEPALGARPSATATVVDYTVPQDPAKPAATKLVVGLVPTNAALPTITAASYLRGPSGTIELPLPPGDANYEIRATTQADNGTTSGTAVAPLSTPAGQPPA